MPMILYSGPTSPFGRSVKVTALELGLPVEEKVVDVYTAEFLDKLNPLRQIPTLALADGTAIADSRIICRYFDSISGRPTLYPKDDYWGLETRISIAIGITEAGLQRRMEVVRPEGEKSPAFIQKQEARIGRSIDHLETIADRIIDKPLAMDQIVTACALAYTDFRFNGGWRQRCPKLDRWSRAFAERPSMVASRPN
ncbi:MAG TPA: glutathione S-transferase family protein [Hypericibacter adhaerens]|uniref:glutathione S-transferase family protein n=1 Tax=Hypericibacter adhaerens TaxID=2602016 RepID=UPI002B6841DF|nr:glutathione S-transferase family protein [Hypericibacter adhaerens]HWA42511.1 glutathione S-transferase family protein [Hypericibacter adhaerens]